MKYNEHLNELNLTVKPKATSCTISEWGDAIAAELDGWTNQPFPESEFSYSQRTLLVHESGAHLLLSPSRNSSNRLIFSPCWPNAASIGGGYFSPRDGNYRATCATNRTPSSIAQGIYRRLIVAYLPEWEKQNQLLADHIAHLEATFQAACELTQALGHAKLDDKRVRYSGNIRLSMPSNVPSFGHMEVRGPDNVYVQIGSVPLNIATKIAQLLSS